MIVTNTCAGIFSPQSSYGQGGLGGAAVQATQPIHPLNLPAPNGGRSGMAWGRGRGYGRW